MPDQGEDDPKLKCKLFIGGLDYNTTDDGLKGFYEQWGTVVDYIVMKDPKTRRSRGFGFITYTDAHMVDDAMANLPHMIDGKQVDPKRAVPRDLCEKGDTNARKLFIGGLSKNIEENDLREYFSQYGTLIDCEVVMSKETGETRGFGFVEYEDSSIADKVVAMKDHDVKGRHVDVKKAMSREELRAVERSSGWNSRDRVEDHRGRGGRSSNRDNWNNGNSGWGNNGGGSNGGGGGGGYNNYGWGGGWGNQMGGNPWNQWGTQGGYNNMGMNSMVNPTDYSGGYTGGYGSNGGGYNNTTGGYNNSTPAAYNNTATSGYNNAATAGYNSTATASYNNAATTGYNSTTTAEYNNETPATANTGGYNTAGYSAATGTTAAAGGYNSDGRGGGGPMRSSYTSNYRSAPYSTSSEGSGGGYGSRGASVTSGGYTQ